MYTLNEKTAPHLLPLTLDSLPKLSRGQLNRQFAAAVGRALDSISEFPCKGEKVESREIVISITLTPEIKFEKRAIETAYGQTEAAVPQIVGVAMKACIKGKNPAFSTDDIRMAVNVVNGRVKGAMFNPNNNHSPEQLELDLEGLDGDE